METPWSSGERQGLSLSHGPRCEFDFWVPLKTRWNGRTTWWQKNENNKDSQKGHVTPKKYKKDAFHLFVGEFSECDFGVFFNKEKTNS